MKFEVGDIIVNQRPDCSYDRGIIVEVYAHHYVTWWEGSDKMPIENHDLSTMHMYNILTSIFRNHF